MVEMAALGDPGLYRQGVAGDSFNTAVYLARAGLPVHYLTRLGNDALSAAIEDFMRSEDIATDLLTRCPGRQPGLYVINNDPNGERQFSYWREHSPARELFDQPIQLEGFDLFYFTGITLAVTCSGLQNLVSLLRALRDLGCRVAFDPNYRPHLWDNLQQAQEHYREILPLCHILLPTLEDDTALWETPDVAACRDHYRGLGIDELVIKGPDLTAYAYGDGQEWVKQANPVAAVDTTSAGDAFNAGYLASRLDKGTLALAITAAQALAAEVVQHRGAITPRECGGDD
jgi:2-dehydro-3-deoxygluconokinase